MSNEAAERRYDPPAWASDSEVRAYGMGFDDGCKATVERIRAILLAEKWVMNWTERPLFDGSVEAVLDTEAFAASILDAEAAR